MSVREELEKLGRLQEIDFKIDQVKKLVATAPKIYESLESEVKKHEKALMQLETELASATKQKKDLEIEVAMDKDRIKNIEGRLGQVTNNKEFFAASKEAEKAKKSITDREKMIVDLVETISKKEAALVEAKSSLEQSRGQLDAKKQEVGSQVGQADQEIASYSGDRNALLSAIKQPLLSRYNRIRTVHAVAITVADSGRCTSCNVALPPQMFIQVQKALELITCPSCQRILYTKLQ